MKQYKKYKPSGVEWLGEIPEHWEVKRVKDIGQIRSGDSIVNNDLIDDGQYEVLGGNGFMGYNDEFNIKGNNIIIGRVGAKCGNVRLVTNRKWITDNALILKLKQNEDYKFLVLMLETLNLNSLSSSSAQPLITGTIVSNLIIFYPPLTEQTAIANYLDAKTSVIDRKIELLKAKAEKYKSLRRSLINETVCRGLNPDAPLKASGIEWIGMIPEHWEMKRFKDIAISITGLTYSPDDIVDEGEGILVLRSGNIQNGELSFNDNVYVNCQVSKNLIAKKDDILVCSRNGSANLVGKSAYVYKIENHTWGAFMMIVRSKMGKYLYYALSSDLFKRNMGLFQTSTVNQLTSKMLDNMDFLAPAKSEQTAIVIYLDEKTSQIDSIIANIEQQTAALAKLRKKLINDVVTGKIKVTKESQSIENHLRDHRTIVNVHN